MYNIAICDDEVETCSILDEYLISYGKKRGLEIETEVFYNGEELCDYLENEDRFDLIFLDIELGKVNGIEVGYILRERKHDEITQVIFISYKENYALQLFKVRPFDFLVKPIKYENIEQVMDTYIKLCGIKNVFFEYSSGKKNYKVVESEIVYFRSNAKKIEMFTTHGIYEFYGKMSLVQKQLTNQKFWCVHKSYIINSDYIFEYRINEIVLSNKEIIPISQAYQNQIKDRIMRTQIERRK